MKKGSGGFSALEGWAKLYGTESTTGDLFGADSGDSAHAVLSPYPSGNSRLLDAKRDGGLVLGSEVLHEPFEDNHGVTSNRNSYILEYRNACLQEYRDTCENSRMDLKQRFKAARKHAGLTQKELAERLNIAQASISEIETGKTASTSYCARAAAICGVSPLWLEAGEGEMLSGQSGEAVLEPVLPITSAWRAIPIVGTAQMGIEGYWHALEVADGYIELPSMDRDAYALRLKGDSMSPAIKSGWIAVCEPNHRLIPLEYVMIRLRDGESMLKELLRATDEEVTVQSVNDAYGRRTIPIEQVETIHYVAAIVPPGKVVA